MERFFFIVSGIDKPKVFKSDNKGDFYVKIKDYCTNEVQSIEDQHELHAHVSKKLATTKEKFIVVGFILYRTLLVDKLSQVNTYQKKILKKYSYG